jgi:hypothetical protein
MNGSRSPLLSDRSRSPSTLLQGCARMHFANHIRNVPNKLRAVHDKLVVHVHPSCNFRGISLKEERIAGMLYAEWQLFVLQERLVAFP